MMGLQRKIQQLRNDSDDEFADAIEDMIPRAEVADALAELLKCFSNARDLHSAAASDKDYQGEEEVSARLSAAAVSWQDAINYLNTTIAKLGLTSEAFDAAIASCPKTSEAPKNKYVYWVTYNFSGQLRSGSSGWRIFSSRPGDTLDWIEAARKWILQKAPEHGQVLITNWIRLEGDECWDSEETK